jgi:hypothetical protein
VIWKIGSADRTEEYGVKSAELIEAISGHHSAAVQISFTAPIEAPPMQSETEALFGGI